MSTDLELDNLLNDLKDLATLDKLNPTGTAPREPRPETNDNPIDNILGPNDNSIDNVMDVLKKEIDEGGMSPVITNSTPERDSGSKIKNETNQKNKHQMNQELRGFINLNSPTTKARTRIKARSSGSSLHSNRIIKTEEKYSPKENKKGNRKIISRRAIRSSPKPILSPNPVRSPIPIKSPNPVRSPKPMKSPTSKALQDETRGRTRKRANVSNTRAMSMEPKSMNTGTTKRKKRVRRCRSLQRLPNRKPPINHQPVWSSAGYSFPQSPMRQKSNVSAVPGPGAYSSPGAVTNSASSFGTSRRFKSPRNGDRVPGPGSYMVCQDGKNVFSMTKASRWKGRMNSPLKRKTPAPGQYETEISPSPKKIIFSFPRAPRYKDNDKQVPGPGAYDCGHIVNHEKQFATLGGSSKKTSPRKES